MIKLDFDTTTAVFQNVFNVIEMKIRQVNSSYVLFLFCAVFACLQASAQEIQDLQQESNLSNRDRRNQNGLPIAHLSGLKTQIHGVVIDAKTGEPAYFANLILLEIRKGVYSDAKGRFLFRNVPYGSFTLRCTSFGYQTVEAPIFCDRELLQVDTIRLEPSDLRMDSLIITANRETWRISDKKLRIQPGVRVLDAKRLNSAPGILEPDLFRALLTLPGVTASNDVSNELYVRGGTPDQNLILLDRAVVYQPYHLFGIAGIFNTDFIDHVNFSLGGFSSQYGNRLSSVIDVRTKSGTPKTFTGSGTVSLLSSKLTVEGKPAKNWYYLASVRRTYLDFATKAVKWVGLAPEAIPYRFYDGLVKIEFTPYPSDRFGGSVFFSNDWFRRDVKTYRFTEDPTPIRLPMYYARQNAMIWGNFNLTGFWEHRMHNGFLSTVTVFRSQATTDIDQNNFWTTTSGASDSLIQLRDSLNTEGRAEPFDANNKITESSIKWDVEIPVSRNHELIAGAEISQVNFSYWWEFLDAAVNSELQVFFDGATDSLNYRQKVTNLAFYLEDIWSLGDWTLKPGVRVEHFGNAKNGWTLSPRCAVRYDLTPELAIKTSGGLYYQSLFTSRERGNVGFLEIPFSTSSMPLQKSIHGMLGAEYFPTPDDKWTIDLYYKSFSHLYRNQINNLPRPVFLEGSGNAYGGELSYRHTGKKFSCEVAYVLAWTRRTFVNQPYYPPYDQRHIIQILATKSLPKNWTLDARWVLNSGRAYRPSRFTTNYYDYDPITQSYRHRINGEFSLNHMNFSGRFPVYHRLDISLVKTIHYKSWTLKPFINLINAYYKNNPLFYANLYNYNNYELSDEPIPQKKRVDKRKAFGIPVIPSFGAHFEF